MTPTAPTGPVYRRLHERLRASIGTEYRGGDRFLTEREVSERFQVSRPTANKALASLVSEGLLEFRRGVGTFVRDDALDYDVRTLASFTEKARAAGLRPSTVLRAFARSRAADAVDEQVRTALRLEPQERVLVLRRLRLADDVPVILEHRVVVDRFCPRLGRAQAAGSLYRAWTERFGLRVAGADEVIRAVALVRAEAEELGVPVRSPALEVVAVGHLDDSSPLWWERTLYRGDRYEFHGRLGPIRTALPARGRLRRAGTVPE